MFKWLARKIGKHALQTALIELGKDSHYLLIVDLPEEEIESLKSSLQPVVGKINMVIIGVPRFYLFQFASKEGV